MISDEDYADSLLSKLISKKRAIGKRLTFLKSKESWAYYATDSFYLYNQAKEIYALGYFESSIALCRTGADYLVYEIFTERLNVQSKDNTLEVIAEVTDCRKLVNDILFPLKIIDETHRSYLNDLYTIGNRWIHPKKSVQKTLEDDAKKAIEILSKLMLQFRDITRDYSIQEGKLKLTEEAKNKYKRPMKLKKREPKL